MLNEKQRACLNLMVTGEFTNKEIASEIKVSEQTLCNWKKNDEFMAEFDNLMRKAINQASAKAFKTMTELLNSNSETIRLQASKDLLDRSGFKAIDKMEVETDATPVVIKMNVGE